MIRKSLFATAASLSLLASVSAEEILVEAESFDDHGGWKLDTQFIDIMGSPYLMAHGLGEPVADARKTVTLPAKGEWHVWVRTKDWVAQWETFENPPGQFQLLIDDQPLDATFGTEGADWHWQAGGSFTIPETGTTTKELQLKDLTGFNGRIDAIVFSQNPDFKPDNSSEVLPAWRRSMLGLSEEPIIADGYDIVFIGGGYAGTAGAISAARMGLKTALVQNRSVLGGNGSSEVRVWAMGNTPPGLYPVGDIIREIEDNASASPAPAEEFEDDKKLATVQNEPNLDLFLNHHAYSVRMEDDSNIAGVHAFDTRTGEIREFRARNFCDSTGHGTIGMLANADREMIDGGRMGMSNMWTWQHTDEAKSFPETPWALDLNEGEFPYPQKFHAQWFWESGFDKDPLADLESIRDWNFRASFGAWNAIKNKAAYGRSDETGKDHATSEMTWLAYIGGPRETQQLLGDIVLTEEDIVEKKNFPDGCVLTTWSVDLHYPKEQYAQKFPENPFISYAEHGKGVDRKKGYPVPYRCFYSRNIDNLFMAGRNVSVTHKALGTVRVMKTCGMMGVVVGKAAAICAKEDVSPRDVYYQHLDDLIELLKMPGNVRRPNLDGDFSVDTTLPELPELELGYYAKDSLPGLVLDDKEATLEGSWTEGGGLKNYVEDGYHYAGGKSPASATFAFDVKDAGDYEVRVSWQPHKNRASNAPVTVTDAAGETKTIRLDQTISAPLEKGFATIGVYRFEPGKPATVVFTNDEAKGNVHIDAVQLLLQK